jgi:hypothetical protein
MCYNAVTWTYRALWGGGRVHLGSRYTHDPGYSTRISPVVKGVSSLFPSMSCACDTCRLFGADQLGQCGGVRHQESFPGVVRR